MRANILHHTVESEEKAKIFNLLQQNFNLEEVDDSGNSVLHSTLNNKKLTEEETLEVVKICLNRGVNPNIKNYKQETVLHLAVARRLKTVIDILIENKADIYAVNIQGKYITHYFIENEYEKFKKLLEIKNDHLHFWDNDDTETASASFVEWLITKGFDFDLKKAFGNSALNLAIACNLLHILPTLLKDTNDIVYFRGESKKLFPLFLRKKFLPKPYYDRYIFRIIKILLDRGLIVTIENEEDLRFTKRLIDQFTETSDSRNCALSLFNGILRCWKFWNKCTVEYYIKLLESLIAKGVNVNEPNEYGKRPLFWAVEGKNLDALKFLDNFGADFQVKDETGKNLLGPLIKKSVDNSDNLQEVFEFLINKGCDVNETDNHGMRLLHFAAELPGEYSKSEIQERGMNFFYYIPRQFFWDEKFTSTRINKTLGLLLRHGAYVNAQDENKQTALCRAMLKMQSANVQELLEWGANVNDECILNLRPQDASGMSLHRVLVEHCIKLEAADLPCSKKFEAYTRDDNSQSFYENCLKEITRLKATFVNDRITLYRWMLLDLNRKSVYINNDKFKKIIDSPTLKRQFPLYSTVILASYREANVRKLLLKPAMEAWQDLTNVYLPDICIERILAYLDNVVLVNMIEYNKKSALDAGLKRKLPRSSYD